MFILGPEMIFSPQFGNIKNFPKKSKAVSLNQFLMPGIKYNFRNIQRVDLEKSSKGVDSGPKDAPFIQF